MVVIQLVRIQIIISMKRTCPLLVSSILLFVLSDCASPPSVNSNEQKSQHADSSKAVVSPAAKPPAAVNNPPPSSSESDKYTLRLQGLYRNNDKGQLEIYRFSKKLDSSKFFAANEAPKEPNERLESIRQLLPERITPLSAEQLDSKVPHSYYFDYRFEPQPGKRVWRRIDNQTWHEIYPDGLTTVFKVLGHTNVSNTEGTIVVKWKGAVDKTFTPNDGGLQAFIPDLGSATMHHWYRNTARGDTRWNDLAPMKDVK
ncbi:MAG: hypothetical protein JWO89_626 [Verrucomicrobiaceae bacterium]|nr:hypothetical protein [Verrucomicrobiaceae bacterium]